MSADASTRRFKIYTKTGDAGTSSLYNCERRDKDDAAFDALGDVDECNVACGIAREFCVDENNGLEAQVRSLAPAATVVACDSANASDAHTLLGASLPAGVLHAAGVLRDRMLRAVKGNDVDASFASKAMGATHLHSATLTLGLLREPTISK